MGSRLIAVLLAAFLAAPASALAQEPTTPLFQPPPSQPVVTPGPPHVDVGIGENTGTFFDDPRFAGTGIRHVRLTVPYDLMKGRRRRIELVDGWLRAARDRGLEPLVTFGHSMRRGRRGRRRWRWHLPKVREYRARVREFRARFPWVREFSTWNEANHKRVEPTGKRPIRTARLYRELRRQCSDGSCTALAADVLLTRSRRTWRWINRFRRHAGPGHHIWGVHNYPDVNRHTGRLTRRFLRRVRGEVWFTETGGIVRFGRRWRPSVRRAARAVRYVFKLARISRRITRIYIYNWRNPRRNRRWDSSLISRKGRQRPAYSSLMKALAKPRFRPLPPPSAGPLEPAPEPAPAPQPTPDYWSPGKP
jgi:polysaccharide biosynthesis protein PslG